MEKDDAQQMKEIMTFFSEKVPALLNSLADVLYGRDNAKKYGEAVAGFYKALKDSGMTDEQSYELTKTYMSAMNLPGMIGEAFRGKDGRPGLSFKVKRKHEEPTKGDEDDDEE
jgi:hypothetical protein